MKATPHAPFLRTCIMFNMILRADLVLSEQACVSKALQSATYGSGQTGIVISICTDESCDRLQLYSTLTDVQIRLRVEPHCHILNELPRVEQKSFMYIGDPW